MEGYGADCVFDRVGVDLAPSVGLEALPVVPVTMDPGNFPAKPGLIKIQLQGRLFQTNVGAPFRCSPSDTSFDRILICAAARALGGEFRAAFLSDVVQFAPRHFAATGQRQWVDVLRGTVA